jgi:hypothetical protein
VAEYPGRALTAPLGKGPIYVLTAHSVSIPYAVLDGVPRFALTGLDDIVKTGLLPDGLDILLFLRHSMVAKEGHDITMPPPTQEQRACPAFLNPSLPLIMEL